MAVKSPPEGYHNITPYLSVENAGGFIDFCTQVFAAKVIERIDQPDGKVMHAELKIGDSPLMFADACEKMKATTAGLYTYVDDVDATFQSALSFGATALDEPKDQFYGDRSGGFRDPFGNTWWVAKRMEDVSKEELQRRMSQFKPQSAGA